MQDVVSRQLAAIRDLLRAAADASLTGEPRRVCVDEIEIDGELPIGWLRSRLGLSETEERVLWVLIAHELCPLSRRHVREMNSEPVLDPTLDALRRVVYDGIHDPRAWRELGEGGALHR